MIDHRNHADPAVRAAYEAGRVQGLREAATAVHALRPNEHEMPGPQYAQMLIYPHVLKRWVDDREAIAVLLP